MIRTEAKEQIENAGFAVYEESQGDSLTYNGDDYTEVSLKSFNVIDNTVRFKVFRLYENQTNGDCYWINTEPFMVQREFGYEVNKYLKDLKSNGTIEGAYIIYVNDVSQTARVLAEWIDNSDTWQEGHFNVDYDSEGNIRY